MNPTPLFRCVPRPVMMRSSQSPLLMSNPPENNLGVWQGHSVCLGSDATVPPLKSFMPFPSALGWSSEPSPNLHQCVLQAVLPHPRFVWEYQK